MEIDILCIAKLLIHVFVTDNSKPVLLFLLSGAGSRGSVHVSVSIDNFRWESRLCLCTQYLSSLFQLCLQTKPYACSTV